MLMLFVGYWGNVNSLITAVSIIQSTSQLTNQSTNEPNTHPRIIYSHPPPCTYPVAVQVEVSVYGDFPYGLLRGSAALDQRWTRPSEYRIEVSVPDMSR